MILKFTICYILFTGTVPCQNIEIRGLADQEKCLKHYKAHAAISYQLIERNDRVITFVMSKMECVVPA